MERICINCEHKGSFVAVIGGENYYQCAVKADVIHKGVLNIVTNLGACEDSFSPSQEYLAQMEKTKAFQRDTAHYYGVTAGEDFPVTLHG